MPRTRAPLPPGLGRAAARFESWRRNRTRRELPPKLWRLAEGLAGRHGVSPTARALRLDYYALKRRLGRLAGARSAGPRPAFVEILPLARSATHECLVEFENGGGAKMRVHLKGEGVAQVRALERIFLNRPG